MEALVTRNPYEETIIWQPVEDGKFPMDLNTWSGLNSEQQYLKYLVLIAHGYLLKVTNISGQSYYEKHVDTFTAMSRLAPNTDWTELEWRTEDLMNNHEGIYRQGTPHEDSYSVIAWAPAPVGYTIRPKEDLDNDD